jgi:hypothetical protein
MANDRSNVEGDFGEGAFGPTILLRPQGAEGVARLRTVFSRLANSPTGTVIRLLEEPGFELGASIWSLTLKVCESIRGKHLVREVDGGFTWSANNDEWQTAAMLVEPLLRQPGHQYLTDETLDDAIVEVTCGESDR